MYRHRDLLGKTLRSIAATATAVVRRNHFDAAHMAKCDANYAQLTPLSTFHRAAKLFPNQPAYVANNTTRTWSEMHKRVSRFGEALHRLGVRRGDVVSVMAANDAAMFEAHFAVPGIGAVLHSINTRLDATTIAYQLNHSNAKVVIIDAEFNDIMHDAVTLAKKDVSYTVPMFVDVAGDPTVQLKQPRLGSVEYEKFLSSGDAGFELPPCQDEWDAISLNYTSGTTGNPKGVVCTHRGAYLNSISNVAEWNMERFSKLLMSKFPTH
jgi:fatty-acyl-CoA synthase